MRKWISFVLAGEVAVAAGAMILTAQQENLNGNVLYKGSGTAVAGARVTLKRPDQTLREVVTDSQGGFTFSVREASVVSVALTGYATSHRRWPPLTGSTVSIEMESAASVSGTITDDATFTPIAGGNVTVIVEQPPHQTVSTSIELGDNGYYLAADLPSGEAIVIASAEGYAPSVAVFDIGAGATRVENFRLPASVVLEGSLLDASGEPVSGVEILFEYQIYSKGTGLMAGLVGGRVETDAAGEFALTNLRPNETLLLWG